MPVQHPVNVKQKIFFHIPTKKLIYNSCVSQHDAQHFSFLWSCSKDQRWTRAPKALWLCIKLMLKFCFGSYMLFPAVFPTEDCSVYLACKAPCTYYFMPLF